MTLTLPGSCVQATVLGMMELREFPTFKQHVRDFLVQSNQFADQNNADLFTEEVAAQVRAPIDSLVEGEGVGGGWKSRAGQRTPAYGGGVGAGAVQRGSRWMCGKLANPAPAASSPNLLRTAKHPHHALLTPSAGGGAVQGAGHPLAHFLSTLPPTPHTPHTSTKPLQAEAERSKLAKVPGMLNPYEHDDMNNSD